VLTVDEADHSRSATVNATWFSGIARVSQSRHGVARACYFDDESMSVRMATLR
jgi:hypothetical protein